jgi:hypothetical protein
LWAQPAAVPASKAATVKQVEARAEKRAETRGERRAGVVVFKRTDEIIEQDSNAPIRRRAIKR